MNSFEQKFNEHLDAERTKINFSHDIIILSLIIQVKDLCDLELNMSSGCLINSNNCFES